MEELIKAREAIASETSKCVIGQEDVSESLFLTLLCGGHSLLLGVPGVGKTLMSAALSKALNLEFQRIQFTPDMMPADITGSEILEGDGSGKFERVVIPGPVFTNILLADEVNRTPPKTQAALLQAMQEREVTIGRETKKLSNPFLVLATQNPIEMEGTYPLPEAQLDRFFSCIKVSYPTPEEELAIATTGPGEKLDSVSAVLNGEEIIRLQRAVRESAPVHRCRQIRHSFGQCDSTGIGRKTDGRHTIPFLRCQSPGLTSPPIGGKSPRFDERTSSRGL